MTVFDFPVYFPVNPCRRNRYRKFRWFYGFIAPAVYAAKKPGEWQTYEITLVSRHVTVSLNGIEVIPTVPSPGITLGSPDSNEGEPGPIMIQGDHGPVEFRKFVITPSVN
ncbi:DUF1080 domain-containing protein [Maribellus comscasis]|uniref:DUF1080 domain-containing protein n=1 Tax=Maribellus comscasis TaxID=2681766 RepID=A0A6I6JWI4_9BACT|nr:DUF1080 domain-containing protein [Maribellus comscasis]QGY47496.1 DUF1080 domain-containing protein [Maribellus comscasis]